MMDVSKYFLRDHQCLFGWIAYQDGYVSLIMTVLCPKQNELILDNGSGNGRFSIAVAKRGARVVSLDINKRILKTAGESFRQEKSRDKTELVLGDLQNLPFRDNVFDKELCVNNLWYVPNYKRAIHEMFRTVKNEGKIITDSLNLLNRHVLYGRFIYEFGKIFRRNPTPVFYRTPKQIIRPFSAFKTEISGLLSESKAGFSLTRGTSLWASRILVKSSKTSSTNTM